jgi:hypothetical protein
MKRAIDFELLAQLAGKERDAQESDCSGLQILVERDIARLALETADPRTTHTLDAAIDRSAALAPVMEKSRNGGERVPRSRRSAAAASLPSTAGEPDIGKPITLGDPNDDIDPDDTLSNPDAIWGDSGTPDSFYVIAPHRWAELVAGSDRDPVSAEEARAVFHWIERQLALRQTAQVPSPQPQDGSIARLSLPEGGNGAPVLSCAPTTGDATALDPVQRYEALACKNYVDFISTVGALHQSIEECYGEAGWSALMECWQEAAGIKQPVRSSTSITSRIPVRERGLHPQAPPVPPSSPSPQSEVEVLRKLPRVVARFWLREELVPPPWRRQETAAEQELREQLSNDGAWCG